MSEDKTQNKKMPDCAQRALAEAEERRLRQARSQKTLPKEYDGKDGPEPTRFGDWEKKGIISDF